MTGGYESWKRFKRDIEVYIPHKPFHTFWDVEPCYTNDIDGNVIGLNLRNMDVQHIPDSIMGLRYLKKLLLSSNNLTDITALQGLTNLDELWLNDNQLTDITALQGLTNLTKRITCLAPFLTRTSRTQKEKFAAKTRRRKGVLL